MKTLASILKSRYIQQSESPVIIYRLGSLGDTVIALPCFHAIRRRFPNSPKIALTNTPISSVAAPLESILSEGEFIQGTISYPVGTRSIKRLLTLRSDIRRTGAQTIIYLASPRGWISTIRDYIFFRMCGIKSILCLPFTNDLLYPRTNADGTIEREAERLARCIQQEFDVRLDDVDSWDLRLTGDELSRVSEIRKPLKGSQHFVINMGGKSSYKDWGVQNWLLLISRIRTMLPDFLLVIVGAVEDRARASDVIKIWGAGGLNFCGELNPRETFGVMKGAAFFIGHDSGPLHLAAAAQVKCVGLFGAFNRPKKWHPLGPHHIIIHDVRGISHISVEQVLVALQGIEKTL